jgi:hypothetical protein
MVNGNSKLKYCLLVQEEKKTANETNDSTWFNYESYLMFMVSFSVICFSGVPAFSILINTFFKMECCPDSYSWITAQGLMIYKALQYLSGNFIVCSMAKWYIFRIKITSMTNPLVLVNDVFYLHPTKTLILRIYLDMSATKRNSNSIFFKNYLLLNASRCVFSISSPLSITVRLECDSCSRLLEAIIRLSMHLLINSCSFSKPVLPETQTFIHVY